MKKISLYLGVALKDHFSSIFYIKRSQDTAIFSHHIFIHALFLFCTNKICFKYMIGFICLKVERGKLKLARLKLIKEKAEESQKNENQIKL